MHCEKSNPSVKRGLRYSVALLVISLLPFLSGQPIAGLTFFLTSLTCAITTFLWARWRNGMAQRAYSNNCATMNCAVEYSEHSGLTDTFVFANQGYAEHFAQLNEVIKTTSFTRWLTVTTSVHDGDWLTFQR